MTDKPAEGKRDKLHPQQWSETLPGRPSCLLHGEIEGLCLLTASGFVWCCDDDFIMSSTTPQITRDKIWRPTNFGCVSVFCARMGSNIKHRNDNRWTPVTAEVFKTFSLHFHLHSNLNSDPEWCYVQTVWSVAGDLLTCRCTLSSSQIPFCRWTRRKPCTERGKQRSAVHPDHTDQLWTKHKKLLTFSRRGNLSRELTPVK